MNFMSSLLGGGSAAQADTSAASDASGNSLSLLGASKDTLLSNGAAKVGGTPTTVGQGIASETKLLMLYFSMHNCPPCREFTPLLVELYNEHNESEKLFEVVFFSGDQD